LQTSYKSYKHFIAIWNSKQSNKKLEILHEWYLIISNSWIVSTICHEKALQYIQTILTKCWMPKKRSWEILLVKTITLLIKDLLTTIYICNIL
jgi:hypothetical protein